MRKAIIVFLFIQLFNLMTLLKRCTKQYYFSQPNNINKIVNNV
jgi:hypothetical protein